MRLPSHLKLSDEQMAAALNMLVQRVAGNDVTKFTSPTLLDIAVHNADSGIVGLIDETIQEHPELSIIPARTITGINYKTLVCTELPTVAFRNANEGTAATVAVYENRLVETFILSPKWVCDKAVADRAEDGAAAYIAEAARVHLEAAAQHLCSCFYYGLTTSAAAPRHLTAGDLKGFPGLHDAMGLKVDENQLVDAGATTTASSATSVWMLKAGPQDVLWVWGNNGQLDVDDVRIESVTDGGGTNQFTAYVQELLAYPGLQIGNRFCVGRIGELTDDATDLATCSLTDARLANLYSQFPTAKKPTMILMNRQSQRQLRDSRTATNATGQPAPFPQEWEGIPIYITDSIKNDEEIALITAT